jgi:xylose isomerase
MESQEGVWDFAAGCMRTYLALKERASRWGADAEIVAAEGDAKVPELALETIGTYSQERADELLAEAHDLDALGARECRNERLDQLAVDLILGLR